MNWRLTIVPSVLHYMQECEPRKESCDVMVFTAWRLSCLKCISDLMNWRLTIVPSVLHYLQEYECS